MPSTPLIFSAAEVSMLRTRACGIGLVRIFAEHHAFGAEVLGIFGAAGDLGDGCRAERKVLADEIVSPSQASRDARMTAFR